ncbi:hypothetical protein P8452_65497 [Trifolium repens]|nr:hypothetical protein P8452_65497 [Trifolium repens]
MEPSKPKSPSPDHADMGHYFESNNEEDISAQLGGSSIDPQSSTSKISAAAGIPKYLLQGLDVSCNNAFFKGQKGVKFFFLFQLTLRVRIEYFSMSRLSNIQKSSLPKGASTSKVYSRIITIQV